MAANSRITLSPADIEEIQRGSGELSKTMLYRLCAQARAAGDLRVALDTACDEASDAYNTLDDEEGLARVRELRATP